MHLDLFGPQLKTCTKCKMSKPIEGYRRQTIKKDGLCPICRECLSVSWQLNKTANVKRLKNYKKTIRGRAVRLIIDAKKRATKNNIKFDLSRQIIENILEIGICERTGIKFQFESHDKFRSHPYAPSLDKINPFGDYTHDNIKVVCFAYNIAKNQFSHDEFVKFCKTVVEYNK